jgi:hypothetical protein
MSNPQQLATDKLFRETMHVAAGDTVAVGTACDSWTYVQHVGKDRVRRGWIETDRLAKLVVDLPFDGGVPGGQDPTHPLPNAHMKREFSTAQPRFATLSPLKSILEGYEEIAQPRWVA